MKRVSNVQSLPCQIGRFLQYEGGEALGSVQGQSFEQRGLVAGALELDGLYGPFQAKALHDFMIL